MILTPKSQPPLRVYHDLVRGWCVEVDSPLPPMSLRSIARWALKVNHDRWLSMKHGDERERLGKALAELRDKGVQQVVTKKSFEIGFD